jgi:hypothetical protein
VSLNLFDERLVLFFRHLSLDFPFNHHPHIYFDPALASYCTKNQYKHKGCAETFFFDLTARARLPQNSNSRDRLTGIRMNRIEESYFQIQEFFTVLYCSCFFLGNCTSTPVRIW